MEIKIQANTEKQTIIFWRYFEAIQNMFIDEECNYMFEIKRIKENKVSIKITY